MSRVPLAMLDLVPISSGSTAAQALRNSIDLARAAERLGYARYWFAEHHLNPGVAGTSPAVVLALTAAATSAIRIGSGAVQMGHRTALSTVEEFGLIDALHPGRLDLGLGRSAGRPKTGAPPDGPGAPPDDPGAAGATDGPPAGNRRAPNGLLIPPKFSPAHLLGSPRFALQKTLLQLPGAQSQDYTEQVNDVLALLRGTYRSADGAEAHVVPGEGADVQVWILGSSGGESAQVAGASGLRFAANYHVSRRPCWRRPTGTGPRSGRPVTLPGPTSASPPTSWWRATGPARGNSPPATARGCAASDRGRARSRSRLRRRHARSAGATRTGPWSPTASTPSSPGRRNRSPTSSSSFRKPPARTS